VQVLGCGVLLTGGKTYCIKKRTCTAHVQAESVMLSDDDTTAYRFCQQCGKFESLSKFDGTKRYEGPNCLTRGEVNMHTHPSLHPPSLMPFLIADSQQGLASNGRASGSAASQFEILLVS
jgi:hypothetical protein